MRIVRITVLMLAVVIGISACRNIKKVWVKGVMAEI